MEHKETARADTGTHLTFPFIPFTCECACAYRCMPQGMYVISRSQFSPSTIWAPGLNSGHHQVPLLLSRVTGPCLTYSTSTASLGCKRYYWPISASEVWGSNEAYPWSEFYDQ